LPDLVESVVFWVHREKTKYTAALKNASLCAILIPINCVVNMV